MSDYMDFWCIDKRKRMHNIIMYILIIALLFVFSNVMIYLYINGTYKAIEDSKIEVENPNITIEQAKATYVNGYVNGKIKNNTEETINEKYIKFEFSTLRDVNIGNKSIDFSLYTRYYNYVSLCISTKAVYQPENAALSVLAAHVLCEKLDPEAVRKGLFTAYWPGRMEEALPGVFLDGAHNEDGVQAFLDSVRRDGCKGKRSLLFGVVADKRYDRMIEMIASAGLFAKVIVASLSTDRSTSLEQMKEVWGRYEGVSCSFFESVQAGFEQQLQLKEAEDIAYVAGSLYLIGQVKSLIRRTQDDQF